MSENKAKRAHESLKIIERIKESIIFSNTSIESVLLAVHYIAELLESIDDKIWAENELNGYAIESQLPSYRKNRFGEYIIENASEEVKKKFEDIMHMDFNTDAISLTSLAQSDRDFVILALKKGRIEVINKEFNVNLTQNQVSVRRSKSVLQALISAIKLEALSRIEKLEQIAKTITEGLSFDISEIEKIQFDSKKIFVVHGRDEIAKNELVLIIEKHLKLEPIVLMDKANEGKTIIEKFEKNTLNVGYAFVLLTPDDVGGLQAVVNSDSPDSKKLEPRARENVLLELGYFTGKLGRSRVCCIQKGDKELVPSDLHGLTTIRYKDSVKDKFLDIKTELENAGYSV